MLRELFTNRLFLSGLIFCVLVVTGSLFWSQRVHRELRESEAETRRFIQDVKKKNAADARVRRTELPKSEMQEHPATPLSPGRSSERVPAALAGPSLENADTVDIGRFPSEDGTSEKATEASEEASRDFPEVPDGFPADLMPVWVQFPNYQKGDLHDLEMMYRVLIKLWNQGDHGFVNGYYRDANQKVYPLYPDVIYVVWKNEVVDGPEGPVTLHRVPGKMIATHDRGFTHEEQLSGKLETLYPDVKFIDLNTAGYDPETFLTNDEK